MIAAPGVRDLLDLTRATEVVLRSRAEIAALLGDELVAPGMVDIVDWPAPDPGARPTGGDAAIATPGRGAPRNGDLSAVSNV
ncbi:MAG: S-adenosyl methyltransferase [Actinomycetospora sp.]|nr:S-adenosyl methyltransferase [Actinomycetospora sp.]